MRYPSRARVWSVRAAFLFVAIAIVSVLTSMADGFGVDAVAARMVFLGIFAVPAFLIAVLMQYASDRHGIAWHYTKTALLILLGTLIVKMLSGGAVYRGGGAVPTILLALVVIAPVAIAADLSVRWKTRRGPRRK